MHLEDAWCPPGLTRKRPAASPRSRPEDRRISKARGARPVGDVLEVARVDQQPRVEVPEEAAASLRSRDADGPQKRARHAIVVVYHVTPPHERPDVVERLVGRGRRGEADHLSVL